MIKKAFLLLIVLVSNSANSDTLLLGEFDQAKLGEMLNRLPDAVKSKTVHKRFWFSRDYTIKTIFPVSPNVFGINCESNYFNNSPYPSFTRCTVTIKADDPSVIHQNDVLQISLEKSEESLALYETIPYGLSLKKFYSYGRDEGVSFEGIPGNIFHYQFLCSENECKLNFSKKNLQIETFTIPY